MCKQQEINSTPVFPTTAQNCLQVHDFFSFYFSTTPLRKWGIHPCLLYIFVIKCISCVTQNKDFVILSAQLLAHLWVNSPGSFVLNKKIKIKIVATSPRAPGLENTLIFLIKQLAKGNPKVFQTVSISTWIFLALTTNQSWLLKEFKCH